MIIKFRDIFLILCLLLPISCATHPAKQFYKAVADAAIVEKKDVYTNLISITKDNDTLIWNQDKRKIKVVMWKSLKSFNAYYKDQHKTSPWEKNVTWVTTAPQVQLFGREYLKKSVFRLKIQTIIRSEQGNWIN